MLPLDPALEIFYMLLVGNYHSNIKDAPHYLFLSKRVTGNGASLMIIDDFLFADYRCFRF